MMLWQQFPQFKHLEPFSCVILLNENVDKIRVSTKNSTLDHQILKFFIYFFCIVFNVSYILYIKIMFEKYLITNAVMICITDMFLLKSSGTENSKPQVPVILNEC